MPCYLTLIVLPILAIFVLLKKSTRQPSKRTDKEKHIYYPMTIPKKTDIGIDLLKLLILCVLFPVAPASILKAFDVKINWFILFGIFALCGLVIHLVFRFLLRYDVESVELDEHGLEVIHKNGKRDLYPLSSYVDWFDMLKFQTAFTKTFTVGIIFKIGDKQKEAYLGCLGKEGFKELYSDIEYYNQNGCLPVVNETDNAEVSEDIQSGKTDISAPLLSDFRSYIFVKYISEKEIRKALMEYYELYIGDKPYEFKVGKLEAEWCFIEMYLKNEKSGINLFWEYLNVFLWMSDKAKVLFGYSVAKKKGLKPLIVMTDYDNPLGDTCNGMMSQKYFRANIPEESIEWGEDVPRTFVYRDYIERTFWEFKNEWLTKLHRQILTDCLIAIRDKDKLWTIRVTDNEHTLTMADDYENILDNALTDVEEGREEFVVLTPPSPIMGVTFLQTCKENDSDLMHIEAGFNKKTAEGKPYILCRDNVSLGEALDIFMDFFDLQDIDTFGWYELGYK